LLPSRLLTGSHLRKQLFIMCERCGEFCQCSMEPAPDQMPIRDFPGAADTGRMTEPSSGGKGPEAWRHELSARLNRYRTRHKAPPRFSKNPPRGALIPLSKIPRSKILDRVKPGSNLGARCRDQEEEVNHPNPSMPARGAPRSLNSQGSRGLRRLLRRINWPSPWSIGRPFWKFPKLLRRLLRWGGLPWIPLA
jgi:hypothetical protein